MGTPDRGRRTIPNTAVSRTVASSTWSGRGRGARFGSRGISATEDRWGAKREPGQHVCFWLQLGVSGFRIDAVPFLIEHLGLEHPPPRNPSEYLGDMRRFLSWRRAESVLLAEANVTMKDVTSYFGSGDRMHMVFNFMLNQHLFLSFARRDAEPIRRVLSLMPDLPVEAQWGTFLRNHDELDLGRLSTAERQEVFEAMAPDSGMIVYDRGIRRRLAPMLNGDLRRLKLAYSLLFALPGTPVIWYGDEIGMGDNLALKERDAVRTPLQWSSGPNAGFSPADEGALVRPMPADRRYGPEAVNIRDQNTDPDSLLNFIRDLIRVRRSVPEIGWGEWKVLDIDTRVLGLRVEWRGNTLLTFHNLSDDRVVLKNAFQDESAGRETLLDGSGSAGSVRDTGRLELPAFGYLWLRPKLKRQ